jgi:hypothetical protein
MPAPCRCFAPPAAIGFGSLTANTTLDIPDLIIASVHGGVFP